jgi:hypothetical protein
MRSKLQRCLILAVVFGNVASIARGQVETNAAAGSSIRLPPVIVSDTNLVEGLLQEEQVVGPYQQPEWTTRRRFATTRVYVLPPWQFEFEQWWQGKFPREGKSDQLFQSEIEAGLPYRFQMDFYENVERNQAGTLQHQGNQVELRWALADWGKIPFNPTLYGEWKFNDHEADAFEVKLLLAEDLAPRWHWGFNGFYEQQVGGGRTSEAGFSQALSCSMRDQKLSLGVEMNLERRSGRNFDGKPAVEFLLGPSIQWRPTARTHLDLVPLFGTTGDSPVVEAFIVFGFDFGPGGGRSGGHAPASSMSR